MTTQHSPLPWKVQLPWKAQWMEIRDTTQQIITTIEVETRNVETRNGELEKANAQFIVQACNNFDSLLEACKNAHSALKTLFYNHPTDETGRELVRHLQLAIAKAEKGEDK